MWKCVYLDVAYVLNICSVLSGCYVCFIMVLRCFAGVSHAYFKCFIYLEMYIANVASGYFKSRSGVASHSLIAFDCFTSCLHLLSVSVRHPNQRRRRAPPPPFLLDACGASWDGDATGDKPPRVQARRAPSVPLCEGGIGSFVSSVMRWD
jgi:hypothetical protein